MSRHASPRPCLRALSHRRSEGEQRRRAAKRERRYNAGVTPIARRPTFFGWVERLSDAIAARRPKTARERRREAHRLRRRNGQRLRRLYRKGEGDGPLRISAERGIDGRWRYVAHE